MKRKLRVRLPGHQVGTLEQELDGRVHWYPEAAWERAGQRPRLGVDFLREPGPRRSERGLLPWFENLLPEEGGELRRRLCALFDLREGQSFLLLKALGTDLPGAVELIGDEDKDEQLSTTLSVDNDAAHPEMAGHFSSLAGMQLKFTMSMLNERLSLPAQSGAEQWIVKLPGEQYTDLPKVEAVTMSWARAAGFNVPDHRVVNVDQLTGLPSSWIGDLTEVFAVRRFDRRADGSKVHQEDFCQALGLPPRHRFGETNPRISFDGILRFVVDVSGEGQGREFARRLGFMLACGNDDAHLKNWSFIWGEGSHPTLSPCYDLVSTVAWPRLGWSERRGPTLALRLGGARHFAEVGEAVLKAFSKRSQQTWAGEEVTNGVLRAKTSWPQVCADAPSAMHTALSTHWQRVPLLKALGMGE